MSRHRDFERRSFLKGAGITLAGLGLTSLFPSSLMNYALAAGPHSNKRFLFIFMRGGNDGINTLIPHGDPDYSEANRPTLFRPYDPVYDLNGFASINPSMGDLLELFDAGDLALIHRMGYTNQSRSHFDSQRIWENGDPAHPYLFDGWLYRYLREHAAARDGRAPALGSPYSGTLLAGQDTYNIDVANPDNFSYGYFAGQPNQDKFRTGWREQYGELSRQGAFRELLSGAQLKLLDFIDEYAAWDQANWNPTDPNSGEYLFPVSADQDPDGRFPAYYAFFKHLKVTALSLLESDASSPNGTRIAGTQIGGFDTHESQDVEDDGQHHRKLLDAVAYGIRSLKMALSGAADDPVNPRSYPSVWEDTVVSTLSEFGRTTIENGSEGTDHAEGGVVMAAGGPIRGGVYNCDPSTWVAGPNGVMLGVEGRYLVHRTDYRALFWEILRDHMGADPAAADTVFPGYSTAGLQELDLIV
jgi:uncharacterized protein (DUF1501 family)